MPRSPPHKSRRALLTHRAPVEGRTRSAFGAWAAHAAPIRGRAASVTCRFRLCVRDMRSHVPFLRPAAFPPPSPPPMSQGLRSRLPRYDAVVRLLMPSGRAWLFRASPAGPGPLVAAAGGMRPPRFRTKDVSTCMGSPTAPGPSHTSPFIAWDDVAFSSAKWMTEPEGPSFISRTVAQRRLDRRYS